MEGGGGDCLGASGMARNGGGGGSRSKRQSLGTVGGREERGVEEVGRARFVCDGESGGGREVGIYRVWCGGGAER